MHPSPQSTHQEDDEVLADGVEYRAFDRLHRLSHRARVEDHALYRVQQAALHAIVRQRALAPAARRAEPAADVEHAAQLAAQQLQPLKVHFEHLARLVHQDPQIGPEHVEQHHGRRAASDATPRSAAGMGPDARRAKGGSTASRCAIRGSYKALCVGRARILPARRGLRALAMATSVQVLSWLRLRGMPAVVALRCPWKHLPYGAYVYNALRA
eukprot:1245743-Pleurochrysis_carterae.AAC.2